MDTRMVASAETNGARSLKGSGVTTRMMQSDSQVKSGLTG